MKKEAIPLPLSKIVRQNFTGPFLLRAVKANPNYPESVKFIPFDEDDFVDRMGLGDEFVQVYPVAAFQPKPGNQYNCHARHRPNASIIEVIPVGYEIMSGREWRTDSTVTDFDVRFKVDNGRCWGKHPKTGQAILPHDAWTMPPAGKDGIIIAPAGLIELRPTCTRTFLVAGAVGTLSQISHADLEVYEDRGGVVDYSYLPVFQLFGQWWSPFQVLGNPFVGLFEADSFTLTGIRTQVETTCQEIERWAARELLPLLHPDVIDNLPLIDPSDRPRLHDLANETRNSLRDLTAWLKGWVAFTLSDIERRQAARKPVTAIKIPEALCKLRQCNAILMSKSRAELDRMFYQRKPKPATIKKSIKSVANPAAAAPTPAPVSKKNATTLPPKKKGKLPLDVNGDHTELPLDPAVVAKLAEAKEQAEEAEAISKNGDKTLDCLPLSSRQIAKLRDLGFTYLKDFLAQTEDPDRIKAIAETTKISQKTLAKATEKARAESA